MQLVSRVRRNAFLETVTLADCAIEIEGPDASHLSETASEVLAKLMVETTTVSPTPIGNIEG